MSLHGAVYGLRPIPGAAAKGAKKSAAPKKVRSRASNAVDPREALKPGAELDSRMSESINVDAEIKKIDQMMESIYRKILDPSYRSLLVEDYQQVQQLMKHVDSLIEFANVRRIDLSADSNKFINRIRHAFDQIQQKCLASKSIIPSARSADRAGLPSAVSFRPAGVEAPWWKVQGKTAPKSPAVGPVDSRAALAGRSVLPFDAERVVAAIPISHPAISAELADKLKMVAQKHADLHQKIVAYHNYKSEHGEVASMNESFMQMTQNAMQSLYSDVKGMGRTADSEILQWLNHVEDYVVEANAIVKSGKMVPVNSIITGSSATDSQSHLEKILADRSVRAEPVRGAALPAKLAMPVGPALSDSEKLEITDFAAFAKLILLYEKVSKLIYPTKTVEFTQAQVQNFTTDLKKINEDGTALCEKIKPENLTPEFKQLILSGVGMMSLMIKRDLAYLQKAPQRTTWGQEVSGLWSLLWHGVPHYM